MSENEENSIAQKVYATMNANRVGNVRSNPLRGTTHFELMVGHLLHNVVVLHCHVHETMSANQVGNVHSNFLCGTTHFELMVGHLLHKVIVIHCHVHETVNANRVRNLQHLYNLRYKFEIGNKVNNGQILS